MSKKKLSIVFFCGFLLINFIFNYRIFKDVFNYNPAQVIINDGLVTEFLTETSHQNTLKLKNPFKTSNSILYPFEINFSLNDHAISNLPFLLILRPLSDIHRSTLVIILINFLLNNILMYLVLTKLKINKYLAFISSLIFSYMPFISHRILGHYTYTPLYFFPLQLLLILIL